MKDRILAHLHLHAVLPALEDFVANCEDAKKMIQGKNFALKIGVLRGPSQTLVFRNGKIFCEDEWGAISLWLPTCRQLNHLFEQRGFCFPIPWGNLFQIGKLSTFKKLTNLFQEWMRPSPEAMKNSEFFKKHIAIMQRLLIRGTAVIGELDPVARKIARNIPSGLVTFEIDGIDAACWIRLEGGQLTAGSGSPLESPDARVILSDPEVIFLAMHKQLDSLAAVGSGRLKIFGLVPLVDGLNLIMDRIALYLKP